MLEEASRIAEDVNGALNELHSKLRTLNPKGDYNPVGSRVFSSLTDVRKHIEMRLDQIKNARAEIERLESDCPESARIRSLLREVFPNRPLGVMDIMAAAERRREQVLK